jgi:selenocysteine lyase/cysteine desulfurase
MEIEVVSRVVANVPTPEFQKIWSNLIECLRLEYENTTEQHPDAEALTERIREVVTAIARLAGCTPASVGESPK